MSFNYKLVKILIGKILFIFSRTNYIVKKYKLDRSFHYVWGLKKSGKLFRKSVDKSKIIFLEDGFIHSYGLKTKLPFSVCLDRRGIFYSFKSDSELFELISEKLSYKNFLRATKLIKLWKDYSISKYNFANFIEPPKNQYVLLIDQTYGDLSISYGDANENVFQKMFEFARNKWPKHTLILKIHPDVITGRKKGYFNKSLYSKRNVLVISELGQINKLIEFSSAVCVVTSQVGFEALIYGKEVHVFGRPFYSGLGLTMDHKNKKKIIKNKLVSIEQLVFGSLVKYQLYLDPRTNEICEVESIMQFIYKNRKISTFFQKNINGLNLTPWKARQINRFVFKANKKRFGFYKSYKSNMKNILVWGKSSNSDRFIGKVDELISVEDGFIRSVGLGGNLYPPLSLLFDKKGIHYDPYRSNQLENLLQNRLVNQEELNRSKELIKLIINSDVSKYNLKFRNQIKLPKKIAKGKRIAILGQVETDNSILYGVPENTIRKTNYSLVSQVKKDYPDSYIIYKPHPDLESGLRVKGSEESSIDRIADYVAYQTSIEDIFSKVDRVVVFTSLGGFEALIRGLPVTTYGFPFYSGWGLTEDKNNEQKYLKRRTRKLSLEELVFISLIEYPFYYSLKFDCFTEIENIINEIRSNKANKQTIEQIVFKYWGFLKDLISTKLN